MDVPGPSIADDGHIRASACLKESMDVVSCNMKEIFVGTCFVMACLSSVSGVISESLEALAAEDSGLEEAILLFSKLGELEARGDTLSFFLSGLNVCC